MTSPPSTTALSQPGTSLCGTRAWAANSAAPSKSARTCALGSSRRRSLGTAFRRRSRRTPAWSATATSLSRSTKATPATPSPSSTGPSRPSGSGPGTRAWAGPTAAVCGPTPTPASVSLEARRRAPATVLSRPRPPCLAWSTNVKGSPRLTRGIPATSSPSSTVLSRRRTSSSGIRALGARSVVGCSWAPTCALAYRALLLEWEHGNRIVCGLC